MTYEQLFKDLKAGSVRPVYLFFGPEQLVKQSALEALQKKLLPAGLEALNHTLFDGAAAAREIIEAAETLPMMCERRLVVVRDWAPLKSGKARDEGAQGEEMERWISHAPDTCCLIFWMDDAPDSRKKLVKNLSAQVEQVEFPLLSDGKIYTWLNQQLRPLGRHIEQDAVGQLVFMAGRPLTGLKNELDKLTAYAGERTVITRQDVEAVVTPSGECTVFQMIDCVLEGRPAQAQKLLASLLEGGESCVGVLYMLTRQLRLMTHIRLLREQGMALGEIEKKLSLNHFAATRSASQAARFDPRRLEDSYRACVQADYAIKSGRVRDSAALDYLIFTLGRAGHMPEADDARPF